MALFLLGQGEFEPEQFEHTLVDIGRGVENIDAFRIVAREMFYFQHGKLHFDGKGIKSHLPKVIQFASAAFFDDSGVYYFVFSLPNVYTDS